MEMIKIYFFKNSTFILDLGSTCAGSLIVILHDAKVWDVNGPITPGSEQSTQ